MCEKTEAYVRILSKFIKDIGFPTFAFILIFYLCVVTIRENTAALEELTRAIQMMG